MASVAAKEGYANLSAYSSASAGVVAFTKPVSALLLGLRDREMTPIDADYLACHKVIAH